MRVTNHAESRVRKRIGVSKKIVESLFEKALTNGIEHKEAKGRLHKYFTYLYFHNQNANNIRIYGDYAWICRGTTLITCFRVPKEHINASRKLIKKKALTCDDSCDTVIE